MPLKKSELYSSLWKSCDELRGSMDASQYKDYVLVLLFVKYVSDKYAGQKNALLDVPAGGSFKDMIGLKGDIEIGDKINIIIPPAKNGDYAFLLHILACLKSTGKAAVILPHGVLFRGNAEATIRQQFVRSGYLKAIIGLPANLFYGTGIPACIVVLDKENATARKGIFMIDASKGFKKDGPKNRLREQDIHKIVDTFIRLDESDARYARMVSVAEIADPRGWALSAGMGRFRN